MRSCPWSARTALFVCVLATARPIGAEALVARNTGPGPFVRARTHFAESMSPVYRQGSLGRTHRVDVTMMQARSQPWTLEAYQLGSENLSDRTTLGLSRVDRPSAEAPNQRITLRSSITAPAQPDSHDFQSRMIHESVTWLGDATSRVRADGRDPAPRAFDAGYDIGPNYQSTIADFSKGAFISRYQDPSVRAAVIGQLQAMAHAGVSVVKTMLWQVGGGANTRRREPWRLSFPLSAQELSNIQSYAQDVAMTRRPDGGYLRLQLGMLWLGCANYTRGSIETGVGDCSYAWRTFTAYARLSIASLVQRVAAVRDPDGQQAVSKLYLEGEVMIGAKPNQDTFLLDLYPYFLEATAAAGLDGSIYFVILPKEADILDDAYVDARHPVLNGHKSLYWFYRSVDFLVSHGFTLPARLDFSFYPERQLASYSQLVDRVMDDFQFVFSGYRAAVVETYYFQDVERRELGQAFGAAYLARGLPEQVSFWATPYGGATPDVGAPFDIAAFQLSVPSDTVSSIVASSSPCIVQQGENGCSTSIMWNTDAPSATAAVWVNEGTGAPTLFACGKSGQAITPSIRLDTAYSFSLYATPSCGGNRTEATGVRVASVLATALPAAPATAPSIQGSIDASPNPCHTGLAATCSTTISWHAAVISGTARVFVKQGSGAPQLFACGIDGQQQAPWIQGKTPFTFILDVASTCASPPNATVASATVTASD